MNRRLNQPATMNVAGFSIFDSAYDLYNQLMML